MRPLYAFAALAASASALCLAPDSAGAQGRRFYGGPAYYQPCGPAYYPPAYYQQPYGYPPGYSRAGPAASVTVGAYDNYFEPTTLNIPPGTTVRWVNYGKHPHTVTSKDGGWGSGDIPRGAAYSATFQYPGTYYYYCRHHTKDKMQGTIVVGAGGRGGPGSSGSSGY